MERGWLGVQIQGVSEEIAASLGLPEGTRGALVSKAFADSPAAAAGIVVGDVIIEYGNHAIVECVTPPPGGGHLQRHQGARRRCGAAVVRRSWTVAVGRCPADEQLARAEMVLLEKSNAATRASAWRWPPINEDTEPLRYRRRRERCAGGGRDRRRPGGTRGCVPATSSSWSGRSACRCPPTSRARCRKRGQPRPQAPSSCSCKGRQPALRRHPARQGRTGRARQRRALVLPARGAASASAQLRPTRVLPGAAMERDHRYTATPAHTTAGSNCKDFPVPGQGGRPVGPAPFASGSRGPGAEERLPRAC